MAKRKEDEPAAGAPAWMATFSDLMNLLLCFFVLLFSMSSVDASKYEQVVASLSSSFGVFSGGQTAIGEGQLISSGTSQLNDLDKMINDMGKAADESKSETKDPLMEQLKEARQEIAEKMYNDISEMTEKAKVQDKTNVSMDTNYQFVKITLNGAILFDSGKADLKKDALPILSKVGDILKVYDSHTIKIEGHTDNVPIHNEFFSDNMKLSSARAHAVWIYLKDSKGMDPKSMENVGKGEWDPVASNKTDEGRAKNRRVEIKIYNEYSE